VIEKLPHEKQADRLERALFLLALVLVIVLMIGTMATDADCSEGDDVALWLARSCVGEAGWDSHATDECAALMHVYLKRSAKGNLTLLEATLKYSGATKKRRNHPRKWLFELGRSDREPDSFPAHLNWLVYRDDWLNTLQIADDFLQGKIADPIPQADHYGSIYDHHRAVKAGWWEMRTDFSNRFYSVRKPSGIDSWKARSR
jgi:hypothetical protein